MKAYLETRILEEAAYIIRTKDNIRTTAKHFGVCKSTVHRDLTQRLCDINPNLDLAVRKILDYNKDQRHIRGGEATKNKYKQ